MKALALFLLLLVSPGLLAQDPPRKKKPAAKKQLVHKKPTPEQIRKFKELEKKQKR